MITLRVVTAPASSPVQLADAKAHLNIDQDETQWDDYLQLLIDAETSFLDGPAGWLGRALITQTVEMRLDYFPPANSVSYFANSGFATPACIPFVSFGPMVSPSSIALPCPPIASISAFTYLDVTGAETAVDASLYTFRDNAIFLNSAKIWPTPLSQQGAVRLQYVAGYGADASNVPAAIRHAVLLKVGHWFANREAVTDGRINQPFEVPHGYEALLAPFRLY